jgi:hypothetical protein
MSPLETKAITPPPLPLRGGRGVGVDCGVLVGGRGVLVGKGVAVGGSGVCVGVGGMAVAVGGTVVGGDGSGVLVGSSAMRVAVSAEGTLVETGTGVAVDPQPAKRNTRNTVQAISLFMIYLLA